MESLLERAEMAPRTTLELGGPARYLAEITDEAAMVDALAWAAGEALPVAVLGGGSNVVVADRGFDGLVLAVGLRGVEVASARGAEVLVTAAAGEPWDELVERSVAERWAGLECLSGIPGSVGATPIQNVGAYGQEVAETIVRVRALERATLRPVELAPADLGFGYRTSTLRREPGRWVVLSVTFSLQENGEASVRYPELARLLGASGSPPTLGSVREAVLELRRSKSMVLSPSDENRRSAGSFFVNPVLSSGEVEGLMRRVDALGLAERPPTFEADGGRRKVPAAWLVERSGFGRGFVCGRVGVSTRHSLALVNRGAGTASELVALASRIRRTVHQRFGILLRPEPVFVGFPEDDPLGDVEL